MAIPECCPTFAQPSEAFYTEETYAEQGQGDQGGQDTMGGNICVPIVLVTHLHSLLDIPERH